MTVLNPEPLTVAPLDGIARRSTWLPSWPLIAGALTYLFALAKGSLLLLDGDSYWHVATGQWILKQRKIPSSDPFSHTMLGSPWTAHEWLSEVILAVFHDVIGWAGVVALSSMAFAATIALLTRALLKHLEPIHALMFAALAIAMTANHLLARPHILAMPLMLIWSIGIIRASESGRAPSLWLLPVMTLWANMHGGFTLGIALAFIFALEALLTARRENHVRATARPWIIFLILAILSALITPHGPAGIFFTWQILFEGSYALSQIIEWKSPNFHQLQPFELWLLGGLALVMHRGLKLPPIRLLLLLGFIHLALKHARNIELLGLLVPLMVSKPVSDQWYGSAKKGQQLEAVDRFFRIFSAPAGGAALILTFALTATWSLWIAHVRPPQPPSSIAPALAIQAVQNEQIKGPVLNSYPLGGYLIYMGIQPYIDGRADMYKDAFLKEYLNAIGLISPKGMEDILKRHGIEWTIMPSQGPSVALLDQFSDWCRFYEDKTTVVHIKIKDSKSRCRENKKP